MIRINENYRKLQPTYLFVEIGRRVAQFQKGNPDRDVIKLGIGDVTRPLPPTIVSAFRDAVLEMGDATSFRGYGPEQGYGFLRDAIARHDFSARGANVSPDDIFVSDGAKCDSGNFQELFSTDIAVAIPDPVYPVYVDTNVMAGRTGEAHDGRYRGLTYLPATRENGFVPSPPDTQVDLVYLCFPNNPTGATATREQLAEWVAYAIDNKALILFDAAYVEFIRDPSIPRSIYEIEGADRVAVEFRSFSKTAGFTGTRCAYTVVPGACTAYTADGKEVSVRDLWNRRHSTKFNGVSYPVQRAAAAVYTDAGRREITELADYYLGNAAIIRNKMTELGFSCTGGDNSPYIWVETGRPSWQFFDLLLEKAGIVTTPGAGFGTCGEGYIRISAFNDRDKVELAMDRIGSAIS